MDSWGSLYYFMIQAPLDDVCLCRGQNLAIKGVQRLSAALQCGFPLVTNVAGVLVPGPVGRGSRPGLGQVKGQQGLSWRPPEPPDTSRFPSPPNPAPRASASCLPPAPPASFSALSYSTDLLSIHPVLGLRQQTRPHEGPCPPGADSLVRETHEH